MEKIRKKKIRINYKNSAFDYNLDKDKRISWCFIVPFQIEDDNYTGCKSDLSGWNYDEILITEQEYKKLLKKSKLLKVELKI
jgi:hypothetical protein